MTVWSKSPGSMKQSKSSGEFPGTRAESFLYHPWQHAAGFVIDVSFPFVTRPVHRGGGRLRRGGCLRPATSGVSFGASVHHPDSQANPKGSWQDAFFWRLFFRREEK
jgi:hypothetical protein